MQYNYKECENMEKILNVAEYIFREYLDMGIFYYVMLNENN